MRLDIPYSYTPTLTLDASTLVPGGKLQLGGKTEVDVPEVADDDAPVAFVAWNPVRCGVSWRKRGGSWLRPLNLDSLIYSYNTKPLDVRSLADLAAAGFEPRYNAMSGFGLLEQGRAVEIAAAGKVLYDMLERKRPRGSSGTNRNLIDSGDYKQAQAAARAAWMKLGIVIVADTAWQTVAEPVFVLQSSNEVLVLPKNAEAASGKWVTDRVFPIDDWSGAAAQAERLWTRTPQCPVEFAEPAALLKP